MKQQGTLTQSSGKWSPRKSLFIVVVGAAVGWVAAIVSVYGIMRSMDGDRLINSAPTTIASDQDYKALSEIAPAAGLQSQDEVKDEADSSQSVKGTDRDQP